MSVLIGGGSGFVGSALVQALAKSGLKTKIVTRKPNLPNSITWQDLAKQGLPDDTKYVVNLAGANLGDFTKRWEAAYKKEVFDSRIETTRSLANAIANSKPLKTKVFLQTSAVGFYPPSDSAEYTEDSVGGDKTDVFTELCGLWEAAGTLPAAIDVRRVIVRFGVVLGRKGGLVKSTYWPFFFGLGGPTGSGRQWLPWIHIDDLTGLLTHLLRDETAARGVYNAVSPQPCTNGQFAQSFARALGRPALFGTPEFVLKCMFDKDRAKMILTGQKVLPKRTLDSGYRFKYPDVDSACLALAKEK